MHRDQMLKYTHFEYLCSSQRMKPGPTTVNTYTIYFLSWSTLKETPSSSTFYLILCLSWYSCLYEPSLWYRVKKAVKAVIDEALGSFCFVRLCGGVHVCMCVLFSSTRNGRLKCPRHFGGCLWVVTSKLADWKLSSKPPYLCPQAHLLWQVITDL